MLGEALDEGDGVPVLVDTAEIRRAARRNRRRLRVERTVGDEPAPLGEVLRVEEERRGRAARAAGARGPGGAGPRPRPPPGPPRRGAAGAAGAAARRRAPPPVRGVRDP